MFNKDELDKFYRYAISLSKNGDLAYDLLQSAIERYLRKAGDSIGNPNAYLRMVIRNLFIDHQRRNKIVPMISIENNEILDSELHLIEPIDDRFMDDILMDQQEIELLTKSLAPDESELLYLWAVEEYSTSEIAVITKQPKGTVLSKLHRLKIRIRQQVSETTLSINET